MHRRREDAGDVTHDEAENDVEEPTGDVCEQHGHTYRPWSFDGRVLDFFGDVCGCVVVGHGPRDGEEAEHEGPSRRSPARCVLDVREDVLGGVVRTGLFGQGQECNAARHQD